GRLRTRSLDAPDLRTRHAADTTFRLVWARGWRRLVHGDVEPALDQLVRGREAGDPCPEDRYVRTAAVGHQPFSSPPDRRFGVRGRRWRNCRSSAGKERARTAPCT